MLYQIVTLTFQAYFGGTRVCQDEAAGGGSPRELICGGCSNKERKQVSIANIF